MALPLQGDSNVDDIQDPIYNRDSGVKSGKICISTWLRSALDIGDIRVDVLDELEEGSVWNELRYLRTCTPTTSLREVSHYVEQMRAESRSKKMRLVAENEDMLVVYDPANPIEWD